MTLAWKRGLFAACGAALIATSAGHASGTGPT
ncbi:MAG: hypothetical protein QOF55_2157, partial [Thermoleophilaceae bacterium]|nr:hypothetical protein [Thermoleophilaceae bacterium]